MLNFLRHWRRRQLPSGLHPNQMGFHVAPEVKASRHQDGVVLIHLGRGTVFSANRVGAMIWEGAVERQSFGQVTASISHEFDIPPQTAERDAAEFLAQLAAEGLLVSDAN